MNKDNKYISLHLHTTKGSIGDSILDIDDYIEKAKQLGLKALSITNHGSMADCFEFYQKCKDNNIKPIIGCEVYIDPIQDNNEEENKKKSKEYDHLVLIAINKKGFYNLLKIHNDAQLNGFYYKPRTNINILKQYNEGIIASTACIGGTLPKMILDFAYNNTEEEKDYEQVQKDILDYINEYKGIFKNRFYLEIQPGNFEKQQIVNEVLIDLSKETDTPLLVTNDVHYLDKEDYLAHDIHVCSARKAEVDLNNLKYPDKCYYVMTNEELIAYFPAAQKEIVLSAINNIYNIINIVEDYDIIPDHTYMPNFSIPDNYTPISYIEDLCFKQLDKISYKIKDPSIYVQRLYTELDTIKKLKFEGYFLTVADYLKWCRDNNILIGPGRGSCCGSLICYLIGITKVDPIKYNLLFERFLSVNRPSNPDIDIDVMSSQRDKLFNYVVNKYGKDHCCLVSTFGTRKAKLAIKDTGRVYGIDRDTYEYAASLIPSVYYIDNEDGDSEKLTDLSIKDSIKINPELEQMSLLYPDWFNAAIKLSDLPKATSIHAAGTIISPKKLDDLIPLIKSKNENLLATSLTLKDAESAGVIKYDFLALSTLDTINRVQKMIHVDDIYELVGDDFDDEKVWNTISSKYTTGLFQVSSNLYKQRMSRLNPRTIEQLATCLALVRGPCVANKTDEKYMLINEGKEEIELIHPIYDEVTKETNGILVYQEQLMQICFNIGFTLDDGYRIMKLAAKKKMDELRKYEEQFLILAAKKQMDELTAKKIFKMIVDSGLYSFNKSHALAYAITVYITAYLKTYYTREFLAASLTNAYERKENPKDLVSDCRRLGYKFLNVDINKSNWDFTLEDNNFIRIGFCAVKNCGLPAWKEIKENRPFDSLNDLLDKVVKRNCGKKAITPLIFTNAFNSLYEDKSKKDIYLLYNELIKTKEIDQELSIPGSKNKISINASDLDLEKAFLDYPFINDPVNDLTAINIDNIKLNNSFNILAINSKIKKHKVKKDRNMAFLYFSTGDRELEAVIFNKQYELYKQFCKKNLCCLYNLTKKKDSYIVNSISINEEKEAS